MKQIKCDKCKKDITDDIHVQVKIDTGYEFDFCNNCYNSFIKTIGSWLQKPTND